MPWPHPNSPGAAMTVMAGASVVVTLGLWMPARRSRPVSHQSPTRLPPVLTGQGGSGLPLLDRHEGHGLPDWKVSALGAPACP